jgi:predicted acetyltransferase
MRIVTYGELEPKDDFMMLMDVAFWWPITPKTMEESIEADVRLKDSPVGFCAVENGRLAGFVGVMEIPTKTVSGNTEIVGGVWGVATNPASACRGICKALMEEAHNYFRSQDYTFSFLCTNPTIIAYGIYRRMGYEEVEAANQITAVYKVMDRPQSRKKSSGVCLDPARAYQLYAKFTEGKVGLVVRQEDFVTMYAKRKRFDQKKSILKPNGYVLLSDTENVIRVRDMVALDYETYGELIDDTEQLAQKGVINGSVADEALVHLYRSKGYRLQRGHNGVVMVKRLKDARFDDVYGPSFYIGALDWF